MVKKYLSLAVFTAFMVGLFVGNVSAQTSDAVSSILEAERVTATDLGVADPGVLPASPLYFLKEWRRSIKTFFTFNPLTRAELELRFANEKAAEVQKVFEESPADTEALTKAIENYKYAQKKLKTRLESLKETPQGFNVDRLLESLIERSVKHIKLFEELSKKLAEETPPILKEAADEVTEVLAEGFSKEEPVKFAAKLEKVFTEEEGSELKHVRSLEIIDKLSALAPEAARNSLERLRVDFSGRLNEDLKTVIQKVGEEKLKEAITALPGDEARRSVILEEVRAKAESRVAEAIKQANSVLEGVIKERGHIASRAKKQIAIAEKVIGEARERIAQAGGVDSTAGRLLQSAEEHLKDARKAYDAGDYGEAYGQARSAEVLARNALRLLGEKERTAVTDENLKEELTALEVKIQKYGEILESRGWTKDNQLKAYQLLDNAKTHLGFARNELVKNNLPAAKVHIGHITGFLSDLSRIIESSSKIPVVPTTVVDERGISFFVSQCEGMRDKIVDLDKLMASGEISEESYAAKYAYYKQTLLECEKYKKPGSAIPAPLDINKGKEAIYCIEQYAPVCGSDGKTYSNECYANWAGVKILYSGECISSLRPAITCPSEAVPSEEETKKCNLAGGSYKKKIDEKGCIVGYYCVFPSNLSGGSGLSATTTSFSDLSRAGFWKVMIANDGFFPQELKIRKGDTVVWTNKTEKQSWPASAIHPTHTVYPGTSIDLCASLKAGSMFDACRGLEPGEQFKFKFEYVGSWKYHDHLNPSRYGLIIVTE